MAKVIDSLIADAAVATREVVAEEAVFNGIVEQARASLARLSALNDRVYAVNQALSRAVQDAIGYDQIKHPEEFDVGYKLRALASDTKTS